MNGFRPCARRAAFALATLAAAIGAVPSASAAERSVGDLKCAYLACEAGAAEARGGRGDAMQCSMVYEALKQHGFGGDFRALMTWFRSARPGASAPGGRIALAEPACRDTVRSGPDLL